MKCYELSLTNLTRMATYPARHRHWSRFRWLVVLTLLLGLLLVTAPTGASSNCADSTNSYVIVVCIEDPVDGATISGEQTISAATSISPGNPGIQKLIFYLGGEYLLTDFEADYTFTLPSDHFVDGIYSLEVEVVMRDGFVSDRAGISVTFANGVTTPPVNNNTFTPRQGIPADGGPFVIAATGDGASGRNDAQAVSDLIANADPNMLLYLGDVYEEGTYTEFWNWYGSQDTFFGRFKDITNPTIGNHEVTGGQAPGYFYYWDNVPDYYSVDTAGWHIISLNSNNYFAQFEPGTAQYDWLAQDLNSTSADCIMAIAHHPVYSVGLQGDTTRLNSMWALMAQHKVDLVLAGHDHNYQRWQPLDGLGVPSNKGIVQFVAGAGGQGVRPFVRSDARLVTGYDTAPEAFGSLFMTLNAAGLEFQYINAAEETLDSGVIPCNSAPNDKQSPSVPPDLSAAVNGAGQVFLDWGTSSDNTGVEGYAIYRNGEEIATVLGATTEYLDSSVQLNSDYTYTAQAFDPKGNRSGHSNVALATTPATGLLILNPVADTYVNQDFPNINYGMASELRTDTSPDIRSYLRFDVQDVVGVIESASLRIFAESGSGLGYHAHQVPDNSWGELTTTYANAPAVGAFIGVSDSFVSGSWTEIDVTGAITGEGLSSFALTGLSTTAIRYSSRQGAVSPQLVIETSDPEPFAIGTNGSNIEPANATDSSGAVHVIFEEGTELYYTSNTSGSFSTPVLVATDIAQNQGPDIAADDYGGIHIVYAGKSGINYITSTGDGSFSVPENVGTINSNQTPALAVDDGGKVHVIFADAGAIYYAAGNSGSFSPPVMIGSGSGPAAQPDIATGMNNSIHAVYQVQAGAAFTETDIFYTSANSSGTFDVPVSVGTNVFNSEPTLAAADSGEVHVAFSSLGEILYAKGVGVIWTLPTTITIGSENSAPDIAVDPNGHVHLAYQTANMIGYTNDYGVGFAEPSVVGPVAKDRSPALAVSDNGVHVVFEAHGHKNTSDIYYARLGPLPGGAAAP